MQQISPKDRPKLIALVVGVLLVVGFGIKSTMDTLASVNAPSAAPPPAAAGGGVQPIAAPAAAAAAAAPPTEPFVLRNTYPADRSRDPFTPVPDSEFAKYSIKVADFVKPPPPPQIVIGNTGPLGKRTFGDFRDRINAMNRQKNLDGILDEVKNVAAATVIPPPVVKVLPPPPPPYAVVGVLIGEPGGRDVAILRRTAGGDKKFVVAGDALEGGYTVTGIDSGGVRVTHPGQRSRTEPIPGAPSIPLGGTTEYYLPKQTTVVPATSVTLPLEGAANPGAPAQTPGNR